MSKEQLKGLYTQAYSFYNAGKYNEASYVFTKLTTLAPFEKIFWFGLASSFLQDKKYALSLRSFAMCALLDEKDPYPHFHAAECYLSLNLFSEAKKALLQADKLSFEKDQIADKIQILKKRWGVNK